MSRKNISHVSCFEYKLNTSKCKRVFTGEIVMQESERCKSTRMNGHTRSLGFRFTEVSEECGMMSRERDAGPAGSLYQHSRNVCGRASVVLNHRLLSLRSGGSVQRLCADWPTGGILNAMSKVCNTHTHLNTHKH